jgi:cell division protein FtsB
MLNLQRYAYTLSDEERHQFADALEQSDDEVFDEKFISWIRDPPSYEYYEGIKFSISPEVQAKMDTPIFSDPGGDSPPLPIGTYSGINLIGTWNFRPLSSSSDIHETDNLTRKVDQLKSKASKELSDEDTRTITGAMTVAVKGSRSYLNSSYALFRGNYDYEVAEQAISKLPMSDELKGEYSNLLSEIRSFQYQRNSDHIDQQEKKIQSMPQFEGIIREEIQTLKEGLAINKELQESISHSQNGLFGVEDYFQILMRNAESVERDSSEQISDMFEHFTDQLAMFDRLYIETDRGQDSRQKTQPRDPVMDLAFEETQKLTNQYIVAINSYMANENTSNT